MNRSVLRAFELKAVDDAARTFEGIAAAYSLDQGGDIIVPGAFDQTLKDWRKRDGKVIPLIDSHRRDTVTAIVGKMTDAKEVKDGLWTKHELLPAGDQAADAIHNRLKAGVVAGMSIGYQPVEVKQPTPEEQRGGIWRYLKAVKLKHNALVSDPMNEDAVVDLESVKGLLLKTSRRGISADELEQMESLIAALSARVAAAKASAAEPVKCPQCGGMVVPTEAGACPECGNENVADATPKAAKDTIKCPDCGAMVTPTADDECPECGAENIAERAGKAGGGYVPANVSTTLAPEGQAWAAPGLGDLTDKKWGDLSDAEIRAIAGRFAYSATNPPKSFGDLALPHHDTSGKVVWKGVAAAMARLNQTDVGDKKDAVRAHLVAHYKQFKKEPPAKGLVACDDPHRLALESAARELVVRGLGGVA